MNPTGRCEVCGGPSLWSLRCSSCVAEEICKANGWKTHKVVHPTYGVVDEIFVDGKETAEELKQFEKEAYERLGITG